ncbi:MAG: hypothetical protein JG781_576 [Peptococcaceae bacterium]|nr:hypothetical protein [Peptococcaceae bacterium]
MRLSSRLVTWLLLCIFVIGVSTTVSTAPVQAQTITYTVGMQAMEGHPEIYELLINGEVVLRYRSMYEGFTAQERAKIILERIRNMGSDLVKAPVVTGRITGSPVVLVKERLLITVTEADWESNNSTGDGLAKVWAENLNKALKNDISRGNSAPQSQEPQNPAGNGGTGDTGASQPGDTTQPGTGENTGAQVNATAEEIKMLELINKERAAAGVPPLKMDNELVRIARLKSQDMIDKNYFDHNSPTYGDPFTMMKNFGVKYGYAGENLAGNQTVDNAHVSLMNSPGHRKNILNPNYTHVGIGIREGGPYGKMFTQMFISKN